MSDILELIDNAIGDYGTSGDAMRWTPEPVPPATGGIVTGGIVTGAAALIGEDGCTLTIPTGPPRIGFTPSYVEIGGVDVTRYVVNMGFTQPEPPYAVQPRTLGRAHPDDPMTVPPSGVAVHRPFASRWILATTIRDVVDAYYAYAEAVEGLERLRAAITKRLRMRHLHMAYARKRGKGKR